MKRVLEANYKTWTFFLWSGFSIFPPLSFFPDLGKNEVVFILRQCSPSSKSETRIASPKKEISSLIFMSPWPWLPLSCHMVIGHARFRKVLSCPCRTAHPRSSAPFVSNVVILSGKVKHDKSSKTSPLPVLLRHPRHPSEIFQTFLKVHIQCYWMPFQ